MSATHKVITPAAYQLPPASTKNNRKITASSTWMPGEIYVRDFRTQHREHFTDPATREFDDREVELEQAQLAFDKARHEQRSSAMEKLAQLAKNKFGNTANMLRAVSTRKYPSVFFLHLPFRS